MKMARFLLFLVAVNSLLSACAGGDARIQIEDAWARPAPKGENTAIYFRIMTFDGDDAILFADASPATKTELHRSIMGDDGTMKMEHQDQIELPKNEWVELKPGDLHVMLMGLTEDLDPGDELTLKLEFENHAEIEINVPVQTP
jgi:copper(I)-binding protein